MKLPKLRTENLIEQNLKNETLVYDLNTNQAFNLNSSSTIVYQACSSGMTFDELKRQHQFSDDFIYLALDELQSHNLLADETSYQSPFSGINRREVIKKVGFASMFVLPIIAGLVAPQAAQAASGVMDSAAATNDFGNACTVSNQCRGWCTQGRCCIQPSFPNPIINPGQTVAMGPVGYDIVNLPQGADTSTTCDAHFSCCDGSAPYGTFELIPLTEEENGGPIVPQQGIPYYTSYDCSCAPK